MTAMDVFRAGCVIPALPLALDANRKWDKRRQRALIRYYLDAGAGGIAVAVHTTQFEIRDPSVDLFLPLLALAAEEMDAYTEKTGRPVFKVAGVCGQTEQAVREARAAKEAGYHAVLLSPGGLGAFDEAYLVERTRAVAAEMPVIVFYLQNSVGGRRFSYDYFEAVFAMDGVIGLKSAPFNRYQTLDIMRAAALSPRADQITAYTGNDDSILVDLLTPYTFTEEGRTVTKSFMGGLLGHWAVWTKAVVQQLERVRRAREAGEVPADLLTLAQQVTDCNGAFFDVQNGFAGCIAGVHEVLRRQGLLENIYCLNPEETLSAGQAEEIDRVYRMYPALHDDAFVRGNLARWLAE